MLECRHVDDKLSNRGRPRRASEEVVSHVCVANLSINTHHIREITLVPQNSRRDVEATLCGTMILNPAIVAEIQSDSSP